VSACGCLSVCLSVCNNKKRLAKEREETASKAVKELDAAAAKMAGEITTLKARCNQLEEENEKLRYAYKV
jgi:prefoldin subunit 5